MGVGGSVSQKKRRSTASSRKSKEIYVDNGHSKVHKVILTDGMGVPQLEEILSTTTGCDRSLPLVLLNADGAFVALHPIQSIPQNDATNPYRVHLVYDNTAHRQLTDNIYRMHEEIKQIKEVLQIHRSLANRVTSPKSLSEYKEIIMDDQLKELLKSTAFNPWNYQIHELTFLLEYMLKEVEAHSEFNIHPLTMRRWLMCVQANYHEVPFHNFRHAFSVAQMTYVLIHMCHLNDFFSPFELTVLLIACICHDVDHPGLTNTYHVNARTELALRYNDISPLENHHCTMTFRILSQPEMNLFFNTPLQYFNDARKLIIQLILSTDMSKHKDIMSAFQSRLHNFDWKNIDDRILLLQMIIKVSDVSNEIRPSELAEKWLDTLLEEYFRQGDLERKEGLPVEPFMDRTQMTKSKAQLGFIRFVLLPMYECVGEMLLPIKEKLVPQLHRSLEMYEQMKESDPKHSTSVRSPPKTTVQSVSRRPTIATTKRFEISADAQVRPVHYAAFIAIIVRANSGDNGNEPTV